MVVFCCSLDLPMVVTMSVLKDGLQDGVDVAEACKRLEDSGAAAVGLNCGRGPDTMLPLLKQIRMKCQVCLIFYYPIAVY